MHQSEPTGQRLTALRLNLASLHGEVKGSSELEGRVAKLQDLMAHLDAEIGFLAGQLRPTALDDFGLQEALRIYVGEWSAHANIPLEFHSNLGPEIRLSEDVETHLYRIAKEALNNTAKHADASEVAVILETSESGVVLVIEDNGAGFDTTADIHAGRGHGLGLVGVSERASLIRGEMEVEFSLGKGTTIYVRVPRWAGAARPVTNGSRPDSDQGARQN